MVGNKARVYIRQDEEVDETVIVTEVLKNGTWILYDELIVFDQESLEVFDIFYSLIARGYDIEV